MAGCDKHCLLFCFPNKADINTFCDSCNINFLFSTFPFPSLFRVLSERSYWNKSPLQETGKKVESSEEIKSQK